MHYAAGDLPPKVDSLQFTDRSHGHNTVQFPRGEDPDEHDHESIADVQATRN